MKLALLLPQFAPNLYDLAAMQQTDRIILQVTNGHNGIRDPAWPPDGTQIVASGYDGNDIELFIINADGTGDPVNITMSDGDEEWSKWYMKQ